MCSRNSRLFSYVTVWEGLLSHTGFVSFVFLVFHLAVIFRPSLCRYLMELCHNVRCCVRWQQSPWVKTAVSSLKKNTCELPTRWLAPFCFSFVCSSRRSSVTGPQWRHQALFWNVKAPSICWNGGADYGRAGMCSGTRVKATSAPYRLSGCQIWVTHTYLSGLNLIKEPLTGVSLCRWPSAGEDVNNVCLYKRRKHSSSNSFRFI